MSKSNRPVATPRPSRRTVWRVMLPPVLGFALAVGVVAHAAAPDYATRDVGGWTVAASRDGKGCFVTREYDRTGQTTLLLGLEVDGTNHLTVLNANWSIKPRDELELTFRLSNGGFPEHFAVGIASDGKQGFVTSFGKAFPTHFGASRALHILRGAVTVEQLSLEGSGVAVTELRKCVAVQRSRPARKPAEKAPATSIPKDPFAPAVRKNRED